jgi:hypothetical protein
MRFFHRQIADNFGLPALEKPATALAATYNRHNTHRLQQCAFNKSIHSKECCSSPNGGGILWMMYCLAEVGCQILKTLYVS